MKRDKAITTRRLAAAGVGLAATLGGAFYMARRADQPAVVPMSVAVPSLPVKRWNIPAALIAEWCGKAPMAASEAHLIGGVVQVRHCPNPDPAAIDDWVINPAACIAPRPLNNAIIYEEPWCLARIFAPCIVDWQYPVHGDVDHNGIVDLDDILCVVDGVSSFAACPGADVFPCPVPALAIAPMRPGGNGRIDLDDLLSVLDAFGRVHGRWECEYP